MAIAFDAASISALTAISGSVSHTCNGSNRILFIGVATDQLIHNPPTYAGVSATLISSVSHAGSNNIYLYYIAGPATGTNTITVSAANGQALLGFGGVSYTGCSQTGIPDSFSTNSQNGTTNSISCTTTSVADNCWAVAYFQDIGGGSIMNVGTGTTQRAQAHPSRTYLLADNNAAKTPAGSITLIANDTTNDSMDGIIATFAPVGSGTVKPHLLGSLGVGA